LAVTQPGEALASDEMGPGTRIQEPTTETHNPPSTTRQVFRREGEYWTIEYAGTVCRLRDSMGLRHLALLLRRAGERVASTELIDAHARSAADACDAPAGEAAAPQDAHDAERARVTVTRAIRAALRRLGEHHPMLLEHFKATIRTGTACSYKPDPRLPGRWEL